MSALNTSCKTQNTSLLLSHTRNESNIHADHPLCRCVKLQYFRLRQMRYICKKGKPPHSGGFHYSFINYNRSIFHKNRQASLIRRFECCLTCFVFRISGLRYSKYFFNSSLLVSLSFLRSRSL